MLAALAADISADFAEAGVTRFSVAYLVHRVAVIRPIDPAAPMQPKTTRGQGVMIEPHGVNESVRVFREIIRLPQGKSMLGTASKLDPPFDSPYAAMLQRAAAFRPGVAELR